MLLFSILQTLTVTATVQRDLSSLIVSARLSRGYAYEPRSIVFKKVDSLISGIPHVTSEVKEAMRTSMHSSYDIAEVTRRLRKFSAMFRALQLQSKQVTAKTRKKMKEVISLITRIIPKSVNDAVAKHMLLPNWDAEIEARVEVLLKGLPNYLATLCSSVEAFSRELSIATCTRISNLHCDKTIDNIFSILANQLQAVVDIVQCTLPLSDLCDLSTYLLTASDQLFRYTSVVWRCHQRLLKNSLLAMGKPLWRAKGDRLIKAFVVEQAAAVTKTFISCQSFPFGDVELESLTCPENTLALKHIADLKKEYAEASLELSALGKEMSALARPILGDKATAADFARLRDIDVMTPNRRKEKAFMELRRLNVDYVRRALDRC